MSFARMIAQKFGLKISEVIAVVYITTHGDYVVHWVNRIYQFTPQVLEMVEESKQILKEIYVQEVR